MAPTVNPSVAEVMPGVKRRGRRSFSSKRLSPGSVSSWLGIRPVERQLMRPWLIDQIDSQEIPGLSWVDPDTNTTFRVPWKHGSRQGWNCNKDACLFKRWARHTGRYIENDPPNPKRWKANFRCAINSLPDTVEVKGSSQTRGHNAYREYMFLSERKPRKPSTNPGGTTNTRALPKESKGEREQTTSTDTTNDHAISKMWFPDTPESMPTTDSEENADAEIRCYKLPDSQRSVPDTQHSTEASCSPLGIRGSSPNHIASRMMTQTSQYSAGIPSSINWLQLSGGCVQKSNSEHLLSGPTTAVPCTESHSWAGSVESPRRAVDPSEALRESSASPARSSPTVTPTDSPAVAGCEVSFHFAVSTNVGHRSGSVSSGSCSSCSQCEWQDAEDHMDTTSNDSVELPKSNMDEVLEEFFPPYTPHARARTEPPPMPVTGWYGLTPPASSLPPSPDHLDMVFQDDAGLPGITSFLDVNFHIFINTGGLSGNDVADCIEDNINATCSSDRNHLS